MSCCSGGAASAGVGQFPNPKTVQCGRYSGFRGSRRLIPNSQIVELVRKMMIVRKIFHHTHPLMESGVGSQGSDQIDFFQTAGKFQPPALDNGLTVVFLGI